ncbi:LamG domain-containing protein [Verrucomicrobiaceae bacterium N1E253]|uniref:LamG domain-containing protein n=1 Tax=Oceaniferula marina TaxID=2748318 RepID=A0A851GDD8_9BACT|nr:LamG domain-containing protein [Oceaniferula marina]
MLLKAPVHRWDDAIPLGNGLMGGLLWGEGETLRLSLDRGDLWDERTNGEKEWWKKYTWAKGAEMVRQGKSGEVNRWWDTPYNGVTPTKLPAGRLEIKLAPGTKMQAFELNLATAEGWVHMANRKKISAFFSADKHVAFIRIPGAAPESIMLLPSGSKRHAGSAGPSSGGAVTKLGYPAAKHETKGNVTWYIQDAMDGFQYCVCVQSKRVGNETLLALAVTSTTDAKNPLKLAQQRCIDALQKGYDAMIQPHLAWWHDFWQQSAVSIPEVDAHIRRQYYLVRYFHGAASRRGAPPMPLQGVWTADNGGLPPWKGDYHNDLNTQMTYIAYQMSGHFNEGLSYLDFLWDRKQLFEEFARDFYGTGGLACPGVMSLAGQPLGGWGQYSMSPTMSAWSAHLFYLHWRYTMDDAFLKKRAYPWSAGVGECMLGLLKPDENGVLVLPLSSSPEFFNASKRAWMKPNSNYDLMCLKMLFLSLQEMAESLNKTAEAQKWAKAAQQLGGYHVLDDGRLMLSANEPFPSSHRHMSHVMALHPFNLITADGGEGDNKIIEATVNDVEEKGTRAWTGYSFSWWSCLLARVGHAEAALRYLDIYTSAFVTRNGFHVNGDQTKSGYSNFTYRPFTLEGNFMAQQAVHEMMLQCWSSTPGKHDTEVIRIFPAMPWRWHDAAFRDLRVEGGHKVSAVRQNNATSWFAVTAGRDATVRIRDNFGNRTPQWNLPEVKKQGNSYVLAMKKGQVLEAEFKRTSNISSAPVDVAEKVIILSQHAIRSTKLPLRIGADSQGGSRFSGEMARVLVIDGVLSLEKIAQLAKPDASNKQQPESTVVAFDAGHIVPANIQGKVSEIATRGGPSGKALQFSGGYLEVPPSEKLHCHTGLTLSAWVKVDSKSGAARLIDKTAVGTSNGYLLDTWPSGRSLRLITREPALIAKDVLPIDTWCHVAATVDGETGKQILYLNGKVVAESK